MGRFGQLAATGQFILYGRKHFTKNGWEKHRRDYEQPDLLDQPLDLSHRVFMITGATSGIGKEIAQFLASKQASVYMLCRNRQKAEDVSAEIVATTGNSRVHVLIGDVSLESDVRRCWSEFVEHSASAVAAPRLDALVCNAGALLHEKTITEEGVEATFASHFLFGTYLLGSLAMPVLTATDGSRLIAVSSGGMYNFPFPDWDIATSTSSDPSAKYDGQYAYAYAKRGQVLLCERWAKLHSDVKIMSCHPGWTDTPGVDLAYGHNKKYLQPMRDLWRGAEGIVWLCVAPTDKLETGAFYLDRKPQVKHMAGAFFSEGSHTKNTPETVNYMMRQLEEWVNGKRPKCVLEAVAGHNLGAVKNSSDGLSQTQDRPKRGSCARYLCSRVQQLD